MIDSGRFEGNTATAAGGHVFRGGGSVAIADSLFCGHTNEAILGDWTDEGGNCFVNDCLDVDGDGLSDCYESAGTDPLAEVPGEYADLHAAARFVADGGVIALAPGTFVVDRAVEVIGKSVAIVGSVADGEVAAIIQGDGSSNLFSVIGNDDHAVSFSDLIMQGAGGPVGSAVRSIGLSVEIENCVIRDNSGIEGGAIRQWLGDLAIRSSILEGNTADLGGALWLDGVNVTIADSSITANQAQVGGAIWGIDGSVQMMRSEAAGNVASVSGGIGAFDAFDGVFLDMPFESNVAPAFPGLSLIDSTVGFQSVVWGECCLADPDAVVDLGGNDFGWPCEDCIGDVTCDQSVGSIDLGGLLAAWGSDDPRYDLDQNGVVRGPDLGLLFTSWGECGD